MWRNKLRVLTTTGCWGHDAAMKRLATLLLACQFAAPAFAADNRCGWFVNPTPGNAWLTDAQGDWIVSSQGGHQADGNWPDIADWVQTNGSYGYGCACMKVTTGADNLVLVIHSSRALPLSKCKKDPALPAPQ
jgi:hypothetical protein